MQLEKLIINSASIGYFISGEIFEDIHNFTESGQKGDYSSFMNGQEIRGIYKISTTGKICYQFPDKKKWECALAYKKHLNQEQFYWGVKGKIFAKVGRVMDISAYEKMKFDHSEAEKARRQEEKRLAKEKRIAEVVSKSTRKKFPQSWVFNILKRESSIPPNEVIIRHNISNVELQPSICVV